MLSVSHDKKIPYTVLVEGNVGAGKSTLVEILSREDPRSVRVYPQFLRLQYFKCVLCTLILNRQYQYIFIKTLTCNQCGILLNLKSIMYFKTKNKLGLTFENCWRSRTCRSLAKCFRNRDKHFGPHVSKWNPVEWSFSTYITLIKVIISLLDTAPPVYFPEKRSSFARSILSHSI